MKKYFFLLSILQILLTGMLPAQQQKNRSGQFPVLAWHGVPEEETNIGRYHEMAAAGINLNFTPFSSAEALAKALDVAQKTGIKVLVNCPELRSQTETTVKRFMHHPAVGGYYLVDEPGSKDFESLGQWVKAIRNIDDKHVCYINLFPNYADEKALGVKSYREYVHKFVTTVPTKLLTFDYYPVTGDTVRSLRESWYENLEVVSDEARIAGIPFWAFALTVAHDPYPIPSLAELRLQVYSNLAYGAQCIQYFTYWTPTSTVWNFHQGPITELGKRTEIYDRMKQVNAEIKDLSGVFLHAKVVSVTHTGTVIPRGTQRLSVFPAPIKKLQTNGLGAVVSVLEKEGYRYLVIVNRDFKKPMSLTVACDAGVEKLLKDGSVVPAADYLNTMEIDPGDIAIYKWKK